MNRWQDSLPWYRLAAAVVVFVIVTPLLFIFQNSLRETLLDPILYAIWVVELAIKSTDQRCIWLLALVITLVFTIIISLRDLEVMRPRYTPESPAYTNIPSRIRFWRVQVWMGNEPGDLFSSHPSDMRALIIRALAYRENLEVGEIIDQIRVREIDVPPEVQYILGIGDLERGAEHRDGLMNRIRRMFGSSGERSAAIMLPNPSLDQVAAYLENLLEEDHDI